MEEVKFYHRKFLNRRGYHSTAFVFGEITKTVSKNGYNSKTKKHNKTHTWYESELKVSDCDRVVSFSIDLDTKRQRENSIRKVDILINFLIKFRDTLIDINNEANQRKKK